MRPIYLIAHRCNDPADIRDALQKGANSIECDVRRDVVDHDGRFPWSTRLSDWLDAAAKASVEFGDRFAMIYFDVKDPGAIGPIVGAVQAALPSSMPRLYNVAAYAEAPSLAQVAHQLLPSEGLCVDEHDSASDVVGFFQRESFGRYWYGNGVFVAGPPWRLPVIEASIRDAVAMRGRSRVPPKVVIWTLAKRSSMDTFLQIGVDALMTNASSLPQLHQAVAALAGVVPATRLDNAFNAYP